jgi:hypothetical protein
MYHIHAANTSLRFSRDFDMTQQEVAQLVSESLDELFSKDLFLLENDVSERAITHKLAEHLQACFKHLNVDCEYNRNIELGEFSAKRLHMVVDDRREKFGSRRIVDATEDDLEELKAYSTFPDIIIHRRGSNDQNLLVIEAKKGNSSVGDRIDFAKLSAFTDSTGKDNYCYLYGVFIKFATRLANPPRPELTWFIDGSQVDE